MSLANQMHHCAIVVQDVDAAIKFFTEGLGMPMQGFFWMHGKEGAYHIFFKLNDTASMAICYNPGGENITPPPEHRGPMGGEDLTPGNVEHLALNVDTLDDLMVMRDRLRAYGYVTMGPVDHGLFQSIYVSNAIDGGLGIEITTNTGGFKSCPEPYEASCYEQAGYTAEDMKRFSTPIPFESQGGKVSNPSFEEARQVGMNEEFAKMIIDEESHAAMVKAASEGTA